MSAKSLQDEEEGVKHPPRRGRLDVRFTDIELDRIEEVVRLRNERDHGDLTSSEIVRMATRKFIADELAGAA